MEMLPRSSLGAATPTLEELHRRLGCGFELSVDVRRRQVAEAVLGEVARLGSSARTWLCMSELASLVALSPDLGAVHAVHSTRLRALKDGPERHAARLAEHGVAAVNLRLTEWTGGLVALFHRFGVLAFGWGAVFEREMLAARRMGLDAVYSDHVDRLVAVFGAR